MHIQRKVLAVLTCASLGLLPSASGAQQSKEAAKADIALWSQSISEAFAPGYWEGETQEIGDDGQVTRKNSDPECIKPGEANKLSAQLTGVFGRIVESADCSTTVGRPGSLAFTLQCTVPGGKRMSFTSDGTYSDGQVTWSIGMQADGEGAPRGTTLRVTAKRTKVTCL